jgi:hypothetical protein
MALIIDPDVLAQGVEVTISTGARTITLNLAGDLSADGITGLALYSFLKEEWKTDATLIPFPFPMVAITPEQFEFVAGWKPANDATRKLIRTAGWREISAASVLNREYMGVVSLGNIDATSKTVGDKAYYAFASDVSRTEFTYAGPVDEAVQTYGDASNGNFDKRSQVFTVYIRQQGKTFDSTTSTEIGVSTLTYITYRFPLQEGTDLNISETDGNISTISPYTQIFVRYFDQAFSRDVDTATDRNFGIVIDVGTHSGVDGSTTATGNTLTTAEGAITGANYTGGTLKIHEGANAGTYTISGTPAAGTVTITGTFPSTLSNQSFTLYRATPVVASKFEIYEKIQYLLRQNTDIDTTDQTVNGYLADQLLNFVGSNLQAGSFIPENPNGGGSGVIIEGFDANDTNDLTFYDNVPLPRTYPYVAAGSISFNSNLVSGADAEYWMYFDRTATKAVSDGVFASSSGANTVITSAGSNLPVYTAGDYFRVSDHSVPGNNGIYVATGTPTAANLPCTKYFGSNPTDSASEPIVVDSDPIDSPDALVVNNNAGSPIEGVIGGASVAFDFDYDNNVQGGRTAGTDAPIVLKAIGLTTGQYVETTGTILRATGQSFSLVAALERNYSNPV